MVPSAIIIFSSPSSSSFLKPACTCVRAYYIYIYICITYLYIFIQLFEFETKASLIVMRFQSFYSLNCPMKRYTLSELLQTLYVHFYIELFIFSVAPGLLLFQWSVRFHLVTSFVTIPSFIRTAFPSLLWSYMQKKEESHPQLHPISSPARRCHCVICNHHIRRAGQLPRK